MLNSLASLNGKDGTSQIDMRTRTLNFDYSRAAEGGQTGARMEIGRSRANWTTGVRAIKPSDNSCPPICSRCGLTIWSILLPA